MYHIAGVISKYTFKMLFNRYIDEYSKWHKKSWKQDVWEQEKYLSKLENKLIAQIAGASFWMPLSTEI